MKINELINETTSGAIATVVAPAFTAPTVDGKPRKKAKKKSKKKTESGIIKR